MLLGLLENDCAGTYCCYLETRQEKHAMVVLATDHQRPGKEETEDGGEDAELEDRGHGARDAAYGAIRRHF